jgi:hypothetical protein
VKCCGLETFKSHLLELYKSTLKYETARNVVVTSFYHRQLNASEDTVINREGDLWLAAGF